MAGFRALTPDIHDALLTSFRAEPGNAAAAAKAAGVDVRTAQRAWSTGWPHRPPIRDVLDEDQRAARGIISQRQAAAERAALEEHAKLDAATTRAMEALLVRGARGIAGDAIRQLATLAERGEKLAAHAAALPVENLTRQEALEELREHRAIGRDAVAILQGALTAERVALGEPTETLAISLSRGADDPVSLDEAAQVGEELQRAIERSRKRLTAETTTHDDADRTH